MCHLSPLPKDYGLAQCLQVIVLLLLRVKSSTMPSNIIPTHGFLFPLLLQKLWKPTENRCTNTIYHSQLSKPSLPSSSLVVLKEFLNFILLRVIWDGEVWRKVARTEKYIKVGQVQWLMPVIPALWEAKEGRSPEVRSSRPAWPTWQNPVSAKKYKY